MPPRDDAGNQNTPKLNIWGKPEKPAKFTKSHNAMFQRQGELEQLKYEADRQEMRIVAGHFR